MYVNARAIIEKEVNDEKFIVIQRRMKKAKEGKSAFELPGGRLSQFESLYDALKREVKEETGLSITTIHGEGQHIIEGVENKVECLPTFAAYQTIKGPVDSVGFYFKCSAEGELLAEGDDTSAIQWISVTQLEEWYHHHPDDFSWVDRAGIHFYLNSLKRESE